MRIVNAYELASRRMFLLTKGKWARVNLMSGERSFLNLFRDSRTPLDSIGDKRVTLIYFVIVQCLSVGKKKKKQRFIVTISIVRMQ